VEAVRCWICRWYFLHVEWDGVEKVLGRYIGWIRGEPYHPCMADPFNGLASVDRFLALGLYYGKERWERPLNELSEWILKLKRDSRHAEPLGCLLAEAIKREWGGDLRQFREVVLVPVPKHPEEKGGYNQALELARSVYTRLGSQYNATFEEVVEKTKPVSAAKLRHELPSHEERVVQYMKLYKLRKRLRPDTLVIIIDDVRTTGATLEALARILKESGVRKIYAATAARDALLEKFKCVKPSIWEDHDNYDDAHPQDAARLAALWERWSQIRDKLTTLEIAHMIKQGKKLSDIFTPHPINEVTPYKEAEKLGVVPTPMDTPEYPPNLLNYGYGEVYPPLVLFRVGRPLSRVLKSPVAVVGARDPTAPARKATRRIAQLLAERGHTIVTGLARGVDKEAASAAAEAGGAVVGVLPHLFTAKPPLATLEKDAAWLLSLTDRSAVVAEHLVASPGLTRQRLAARNRIIAGMSHAVIIPEARYRATGWGTKYQVQFGIKAGRPVIILKPQTRDEAVWQAYRYFKKEGAYVAETPEEAVELAEELKLSQDTRG